MYLTYSQIHTVLVTLTIQNITSWQYGVRLVYIQARAVLTDRLLNWIVSSHTSLVAVRRELVFDECGGKL